MNEDPLSLLARSQADQQRTNITSQRQQQQSSSQSVVDETPRRVFQHSYHQPLPPAPLPVPTRPPLSDVSSLSRGSYGSFSAPRCPMLVTRIALPVFWFLSLLVLIMFGISESRCSNTDNPMFMPSSGWCCAGIQPFTRGLTIATFAIHTTMLTWLLQLYHTPYFTCFPSSNRSCVMFAFAARAIFLVIMWMLYFLLLSLNLISTLPEQLSCANTGADRALLLPSAVFNIVCCIFMKIMLGLMGKSVWKYWELRHLSASELLHYEEILQTSSHHGLTREQVDVLLKVTLTCTDKVSIGLECKECGQNEQVKPPAMHTLIIAALKPHLVKAREAFSNRRRYQDARREQLLDDTERGLSDSVDNNDDGAYVPPSFRNESDERPSVSVVPIAFPSDLNEDDSHVSSESADRSGASLMQLGGVPSMTCGICLDDYRHHDRVMILPCRHHGHIDCLMGWLNGHRTCPMCRSAIIDNSPRRRDAV